MEMARTWCYQGHLGRLSPFCKTMSAEFESGKLPEKPTAYFVQTISLSANMVANRTRIFFSLLGPRVAVWHLNCRYVFGGVPPVRS